jgi:putative transposase
MPRQCRSFAPATSYHVTMRCNNQAFDLRRPQSRKAILFCLAKARGRFDFTLFGICVMSNHVHYMIRPARPADMPRLMHWLNWYSAMLPRCPTGITVMRYGCCATFMPIRAPPA